MNEKEKYENYLQSAQKYISIARMHEAHKNTAEATKFYALARDYFDLAAAIKPTNKTYPEEELMAEECFFKTITLENFNPEIEK